MNEASDRTQAIKTIDREKTYAILQWLNRNLRMLLSHYKNQYVAHNEKHLIAHSQNLQEVIKLANASGEYYVIYLVPRKTSSIQILPIYFRSVVRHDWQPNYLVTLKHNEQVITVEMLFDSGADRRKDNFYLAR